LAPTLLVNRTVSVSWAVPGAGASAITSYRVVASPDGHTCYSTLTSCLFTSLATNLAYSFTVSAQNADGWSAPSTSSPRASSRARSST
jgi:hypothetical protein